MVYFQPQNESYFSVQAAPQDPPVKVKYNNSGLHFFTGPTPFVDINHSANRNGAGLIEGHTIRIDLSGKIIRPNITNNGSGIGTLMSGIKEFREFLATNDNGLLEIECGVSSKIVSYTGARLIDFSINKSDDNWTQSADYSISFECYQPSGINAGYYVKSTSDSWTIESAEDSAYTKIDSITSSIKPEIHNPKLKPSAPSAGQPIPSDTVGPGGTPGAATISIVNIPQYRITHRVSAVGLPSGTGNFIANSAYQNAKKWVTERLSASFNTSTSNWSSGVGYFMTSSNISNYGSEKLFLYNHVRSTNFSITDGSYEINDSWLAMPSGIPYIEDYSIEASTDDRNIKTVRVQGQIRGLNLTSLNVLSGDPSYTNPSGSGKIVLNDYDQLGSGSFSRPVLDAIGSNSNVNTIYTQKYYNALSGWLNDIKPYLYRRAGIVVNSSDRDRTYVNPTNPSEKPNNPVFCKEIFLNPIPTSSSEGHDPRKGTISYSMEFHNKLTILTGVISENISINTTGPTDVFAETFVIGRRLGPVLQSLNAKTSARKDVTIDISVPPPTSVQAIPITNAACPVCVTGYLYTTIDSIISGLAPCGGSPVFGTSPKSGQVFVTQDNYSWNPAEGRFSRNVSWTYQMCDNTKHYIRDS